MIGMAVCGTCGKSWPRGVRQCPDDGRALTGARSAAVENAGAKQPPAAAPSAQRSAPSDPPVQRSAPSDPPAQRNAPSDAPVVVVQTALAAIPPSELDLK